MKTLNQVVDKWDKFTKDSPGFVGTPSVRRVIDDVRSVMQDMFVHLYEHQNSANPGSVNWGRRIEIERLLGLPEGVGGRFGKKP